MRTDLNRRQHRRNVMAFENLDEILSLRSQSMANGSEFGGSENSFSIPPRSSNNIPRTISGRSSTTSRMAAGRHHRTWVSDEYNGAIVGLVNPQRLSRRHSSTVGGHSSSSSSSVGLNEDSGALISRRLTTARVNQTAAVPRRQREISRGSVDVDSEDEEMMGATEKRNRFLACLGCFNARNERTGGFQRFSPNRPQTNEEDEILIDGRQSGRETPLLNDPYCRSVAKMLMALSENTEIDVLENKLDQRVVFLLYAALSGEPLLSGSEYHACDEWVDWLNLGFSSNSLEAFERDVNRPGSQAMGLLFQLFFALEYTELAQVCALIVRNIHLDPAALYGLFAINCSKWTRDVVIASLYRFDKGGSETKGAGGPPDLFASALEGGKFKSFLAVMEWWTSCGSRGSIESVEKRFSCDASREKYASFSEDEEDGDSDLSSPLSSPRRAKSIDSPLSLIPQTRIPDVDMAQDGSVLRQALVAGSAYYAYCMLSFVKFWLQKDLIAVDSDAAREKLNNAYLDKEFVAKLKLSASMPLIDLLKSIDKLSARVMGLWRNSGWRKEDLLGIITSSSNLMSAADSSSSRRASFSEEHRTI